MIVHNSFDFVGEKVNTEKFYFEFFQQFDLDTKLSYYAEPWARLINTNSIEQVALRKNQPSFTVCQHWNYKRIIPILKDIGVEFLLTPHAEEEEYEGIKIIPILHDPIVFKEPKPKTIFASFIGSSSTHLLRNKIQEIDFCETLLFEGWFFDQTVETDKGKDIYSDYLARSLLSLCPRGYGAGSIRFSESLCSKSLPVIISDNLILPEICNWDSLCIRIEEDFTTEKITAVIYDFVETFDFEQFYKFDTSLIFDKSRFMKLILEKYLK